MVRDDVMIGSVRIPMRNLQDLLHYLESCRRLGCDELAYSQHKVDEIIKQLKELRQMFNRQCRTQDGVTSARMACWN